MPGPNLPRDLTIELMSTSATGRVGIRECYTRKNKELLLQKEVNNGKVLEVEETVAWPPGRRNARSTCTLMILARHNYCVSTQRGLAPRQYL